VTHPFLRPWIPSTVEKESPRRIQESFGAHGETSRFDVGKLQSGGTKSDTPVANAFLYKENLRLYGKTAFIIVLLYLMQADVVGGR
jgi:hypothetical protein